jgi:phosphoribosylformimino-5-aminoimidazole carboxamide ribotide isomerase
MARRWVAEGATCLHLVDLDGARDGQAGNLDAVAAIVRAVGVPCELGGGIRDEATIRTLLSLGLSRLVIGTQALKQPDWFRNMCRAFPLQLAVGIDARHGRVASEGWREVSEVSAIELAQSLAGEPVAAIICTDIARDGMLTGPNFAVMVEMKAASHVPVIASGGVTTVDDVERLARDGLDGCIIGRALYEGTLTLADALAAAKLSHEK